MTINLKTLSVTLLTGALLINSSGSANETLTTDIPRIDHTSSAKGVGFGNSDKGFVQFTDFSEPDFISPPYLRVGFVCYRTTKNRDENKPYTATCKHWEINSWAHFSKIPQNLDLRENIDYVFFFSDALFVNRKKVLYTASYKDVWRKLVAFRKKATLVESTIEGVSTYQIEASTPEQIQWVNNFFDKAGISPRLLLADRLVPSSPFEVQIQLDRIAIAIKDGHPFLRTILHPTSLFRYEVPVELSPAGRRRIESLNTWIEKSITEDLVEVLARPSYIATLFHKKEDLIRLDGVRDQLETLRLNVNNSPLLVYLIDLLATEIGSELANKKAVPFVGQDALSEIWFKPDFNTLFNEPKRIQDRDRDNVEKISSVLKNGKRILTSSLRRDRSVEQLCGITKQLLSNFRLFYVNYAKYYLDGDSPALDPQYADSEYMAVIGETIDELSSEDLYFDKETISQFLQDTLPEWEKKCSKELAEQIEEELALFEK